MRPRASLPTPRVKPLNTTPKAYLQHHTEHHEFQSHTFASTAGFFYTSGSPQFTVLDEDALCELLSLFEDLLVVDVGHRGDKALQQNQDVAHAQISKFLQHPVLPGLTRKR